MLSRLIDLYIIKKLYEQGKNIFPAFKRVTQHYNFALLFKISGDDPKNFRSADRYMGNFVIKPLTSI